jgi:hypothetical protein
MSSVILALLWLELANSSLKQATPPQMVASASLVSSLSWLMHLLVGQVLNFRTLAYIADCYSKLRPLHGAMPIGNKAAT